MGYKGILRDRVPTVVNFALKWCEMKNAWVEHVYNAFIKMYKEKEDRERAVKIILGLSKKGLPVNFDFAKTIDWDNMTDEEKTKWEWCEQWVQWFQQMFLYIHNVYKNNSEADEAFIKEIKTRYLNTLDAQTADNLAKYLLKCCKEY